MWLEKQKNIIDFTLSSLLRRKRKNIALFMVYTFIVFTLASVMFFTHALKKEAALVLKEAPEMVVQKVLAGRHDLIPASYVSRISEIKGVTDVRARLWGYYYDPVVKANYTLMVPEDHAPAEGNIVVGNGVSRSQLAFEGDMMGFKTYDGKALQLTITALLNPESELLTTDLILMSQGDFKKLFGIPAGYATDITLKVRNPRELNTIATKIVRLLPDTRPIIRDEILRTYDAVFDWREGIMLAVLAGAVLAFIIMAWDKASGLSAEERKEIGILKAIGWETSDVILLKFWEGTVISLSSFLAGVLFAYVHVFLSRGILFEPVLKGWAILYPQFRLTPFIDPYQVTTLFFLTVIPYTVTTIVPSWRAATVDPDSQVRG